MKRGKDEEKKMMGPLFPRLYVKDTEKGGPRAPPRNKITLYEQLSVPSNRFNPAILPLKQNTNNHIPPAPPSAQVIYLIPKCMSNDPKHGVLDINSKNQTATEPIDIASSSNIQEKTIDGSIKKNGDSDYGVEECLRDNEMVIPRRNFLISEEQSGNVQLRDERSSSDASIVDSASALDVDISPNEVVALIGPKLFWKARRVILDQQRLFAMQVFELHRLIKVQKLIAENPHLFAEDASTMIKPPLKTSTNAEKVALDSCNPKCPLQIGAPTPTQPVECSAENAVGKPLQPANKITPFGLRPESWNCPTQPAVQGPHQWLVPVISPTEGLIYKPCVGGFVPYGSPSPAMSNYMNPVLPQHSYFSTYDIMPMVTGSFSEPLSCFQIPRPSLNLRIPKEFDSQGSTPNSPIEKTEGGKGGGTFKLFLGSEELQTPVANRVIKAVPHNLRTAASESVARIIRSIQEERYKQQDNV